MQNFKLTIENNDHQNRKGQSEESNCVVASYLDVSHFERITIFDMVSDLWSWSILVHGVLCVPCQATQFKSGVVVEKQQTE